MRVREVLENVDVSDLLIPDMNFTEEQRGITPSTLLLHIKDKLDHWVSFYGEDIRIKPTYYGYDGGIQIEVSSWRDETPEEIAIREAKEKIASNKKKKALARKIEKMKEQYTKEEISEILQLLK